MLWASASVQQLSAQQPQPVTLVRTHLPIKLDGKPDEEAWLQVSPFPLLMYTPTAGGPTSDSSVIKLLYDDEYIYAAGWFYTPDKKSIRPGLFARDQMGPEDHFMVILDAANDNQTGYVFTTVPSGAKTDYAIGGDGTVLDRNWNGYWDGASSRDSQGWYSEIRIPLSTLRFQPVNGRATMGLILHRFTSTRSEYDTYPSLNPSFAGALFRPSIAGKIILEDVRAKSPLYLTPYALGGVSSSASLKTGASAYSRDQHLTREGGLDAKFGLTSSLAADLTVNTDFAQAEVDNVQVNLTRFSLFFPEKRQFFLERSDLFAVNYGNGDLLFHSRRIGLGPRGEPLRIYGGARVVGRAGAWDVGALSMQTSTVNEHETENDAAIRVRRSIINSGSFIGGLVTSRIGSNGSHGFVAASDAVVRPFGNDFVTVQGAASTDNDGDSTSLNGGMGRISWERRSNRGLQYVASYRLLGRDFDPGLGFQSRGDIGNSSATVGYGWYPGKKTVFQSVVPYLSVEAINRGANGVLDSRYITPSINFNFKAGGYAFVLASQSYERLDQGFRIASTATIPAGEHTSSYFHAGFATSSRSKFSGSATTTLGQYYDGTQTVLTLSPRWNASEHLQVASDVFLTRLRFNERHEKADPDIARLRVQYAHNSRVSLSSFVQYSRAGKAVAANMRMRWQFAEGQDLWVVYNDLLNTTRTPASIGLPELPLSKARTLLVKYTHTMVR